MVAAALEAGVEPPEELLAPVIAPCLEPLWIAFWTLTTSRPYVAGMGGGFPLPIPYSELSVYARDADLVPSSPEWIEFFGAMAAMDNAYLLYEKERAQAADEARARLRGVAMGGGDVR